MDVIIYSFNLNISPKMSYGVLKCDIVTLQKCMLMIFVINDFIIKVVFFVPGPVVLEVLATAIRQEEIKAIQIGKENKTVFICRWHDTVHTEPQRFYQETTRTDNWIQQSSRIQN